MKLSKSLVAAAIFGATAATSANALTVDQCNELGGTVDLAAAECVLTVAQEDEARLLGWLPGAGGGTTAGLGAVAVSGGTAAAGLGLLAVVVISGDGSGTTTTTTGSSS